ncbi:MAG: MFS transporter [Candidatus Latescibacteria bacterium]|nr:MFS transporter [Candidatus Latescibacterota bacterium]
MSQPALMARLSAMFAFSSMILGAQGMLLSGHMGALGFNGPQISYVSASMSFAALCSPLVAGWLADRFWPSQTFAGWCYLLSAPLLFWGWMQHEFAPLWLAMALFCLIFLPTRSLANVIAFHHLGDFRRFGQARVWGTIGWVGVSWGLSLYLELRGGGEGHLGDGLLLAAVLSAIAGVYAFTLPHTPPGSNRSSGTSLTAAFSLLRQRGFAVLVITAFASALAGPFLFNFGFLFLIDPDRLGLSPGTANMLLSLAQVAEVFTMLMLTGVLRRIGLRWTIFGGLLAQALRLGCFAVAHSLWVMVFAQCLQGVAFTFFAIGSTVAVDRLSPPQMRASAQGLLVVINSGMGALVGHFTAGRCYDYFATPGGGHDWGNFFLLPGIFTLGTACFFGWAFRGGEEEGTG